MKKKSNVSYDFSKKVVLITGGAFGIGGAIAKMFAESKANVVLLDKNSEVVKYANTLAKKYSIKALGITADLTRLEEIQAAKKLVLQKFPHVDILVNNAGIVALEKVEKLSKADWDNTIAINLSAVFFVSQAFAPHMIRRKQGKIINLASQAGVIALDKHVAYCVSKAGVISMTKVMALEWGKHNINVNAVSPTVVLTELGKKAWSGKVGEAMKKKIPKGRFAFPEEIASSIMFLASSDSDMVHGENVLIDGGYSIQ